MINKYLDKNNPYFEYWRLLKEKDYPLYFNNLEKISYYNFIKDYCGPGNSLKKYNLFNSLMRGDVYLIKNCVSKKFLFNLRSNIIKYYFNNNFNFYKIKEGVPNFANKIDEHNVNYYTVKMNKMVFYAFPFNENKEKFKIFREMYKYWSNIKYISGYKKNQFNNFTPKDGLVDRIQIVRYPNKTGFLNPHRDPHYYQKFFVNSYISKKGLDYDKGGFYLIQKNNSKHDIENEIDPGDICIGFSTLAHGVDKIITNKNSNNLENGRWFITMGTVVSNHFKKRRHSSTEILKN